MSMWPFGPPHFRLLLSRPPKPQQPQRAGPDSPPKHTLVSTLYHTTSVYCRLCYTIPYYHTILYCSVLPILFHYTILRTLYYTMLDYRQMSSNGAQLHQDSSGHNRPREVPRRLHVASPYAVLHNSPKQAPSFRKGSLYTYTDGHTYVLYIYMYICIYVLSHACTRWLHRGSACSVVTCLRTLVQNAQSMAPSPLSNQAFVTLVPTWALKAPQYHFGACVRYLILWLCYVRNVGQYHGQ